MLGKGFPHQLQISTSKRFSLLTKMSRHPSVAFLMEYESYLHILVENLLRWRNHDKTSTQVCSFHHHIVIMIYFWIGISICQNQKYHQIVGRQCCPKTIHFPFCIVKYIWANIQKSIFRLSSDWSVLGTQLSNFNISNAVFLQYHLNSEVKLKKCSHFRSTLNTINRKSN